MERDRASLLFSSAVERERLVDMGERIRRVRPLTFALLAVALVASGPWLGFWTLLPLAVAGAGFFALDRVTPRLALPEYGAIVAFLLSVAMIAGSIALTGGPRSPATSWLAIPVVTLSARFSARGVGLGVGVAIGLLLAATVGVHPAAVLHDPPLLLMPLAVIGGTAMLSTALMRSDLLHRSRSVLDPLTGMLNRQALANRVAEITEQAALTGRPVGLVLGDLDCFKSINDEHGHATGDAVLVDVAYALRKELRAFDLAYRVGGEEFLVIVPGAEPEEVVELAERLRVAVASCPAGGVGATMSFGAASSAGGSFAFDSLFARADVALYAAKAAGRNVVRSDRSTIALAAV